MSELTLKQKIAILHHERGEIAILEIDMYEEISFNPQKSPKPDYLYIDDLLGIDMKELAESNSPRKVSDGIKALTGEYHVSDALTYVIYDRVKLSAERDLDGELVDEIDVELQCIYKRYLELSAGQEHLEYEEFGEILGEKVYRRIK